MALTRPVKQRHESGLSNWGKNKENTYFELKVAAPDMKRIESSIAAWINPYSIGADCLKKPMSSTLNDVLISHIIPDKTLIEILHVGVREEDEPVEMKH